MLHKKNIFIYLLWISISIFSLWSLRGCSTKNLTGPQGFGSIFVESDIPGALIFLDNDSTGKRTPDTLFNVTVGSHQLKVKLEGYLSSPRDLIIEVKANVMVNVNFSLLSLEYGFLSVNSNVQAAYITIDTEPTGTLTPFFFDHNIPVGTHIISVYKESYSNDPPAKETVNITTADTAELSFNLTPASVGKNVGEITHDFNLEDDFGEWKRLYAYRGFVCIINFWSKDCTFCMVELPYLDTLYSEYFSDSLVIFALNYEDDFAVIKQIRDDLDLKFILLKDAGGAVKGEYEVTDTPVTIFLDRSGKIYYYHVGFKGSHMNIFRQKLNELFGR